ncbi:MAG: sugar phosphate isomerase/epimerase [Robiginitomaculum sp.]|nr:sugar phosphate isomerase/epimerase [Robiginitomaculum sp.]
MKLAISNIAWPFEQFEQALQIMSLHNVKGLEIAPGLIFPNEADPFSPSDQAQRDVQSKLSDFGITMVSMQSLLYGASGAEVFGGHAARKQFQLGMERAITLSGRLGIPNLVFGSPKARVIPDNMPQTQALEIAVDVMSSLGDFAKAVNTKIAIEPCPKEYGTNFLNTTKQAIEFCDAVNHPAITLNFDLGALIMNDELQHYENAPPQGLHHISHIHISEPYLGPAPQDWRRLRKITQEIKNLGYQDWISIEMLGKKGSELDQVDISLRNAIKSLKGS